MPVPNKNQLLSAVLAASIASGAWASQFALPTLELGAQEEQAEEPAVEESVESPDFFSGWSRSVELGLTGSSGNSDNLTLRAIFQTERETDHLRTLFRARYLYSEDDGNESENEGRLRGENDWKFVGERYYLFALGVFDWDEFQDWDQRIQLFAGLGYEFLKERSLLESGQDRASLNGRLGAGATREFGSGDDDWHPEALIGLDFFWQITDRNSFAAGTEVFPALDDFGELRAISYAAYDIQLADDGDLRLRLGVEHEYDSDSGDAKENDVSYFVTILATF